MAPPARISKRYFSWEQIHSTVLQSVESLMKDFNPTLLVGISGGGLIPSRMLRSGIKMKAGKTLPIQVVGAVHYDDDAGKVHDIVQRTQWLSPDLDLSGQRVLLVDEVDDSRKTFAFIVAEMLKYFEEAKAAHEAKGTGQPWVQPVLGTYVIHNKIRPKEAVIDSAVFPDRYFAGEHVPNMWNVYPWDAEDIMSHTAVAHAQEHYFREKPGELQLALQACADMEPAQAASAYVHYADGGSTAAPRLGPGGFSMSVIGNKNKSALTSALSSTGAPRQSVGDHVDADGNFHTDIDGMYANFGYVPAGLQPRIGSLTLVDAGSSLAARAAREEQQNGR